MQNYHDTEWGRPSHDDAYLFEMLILEGAQAGLSWSTVLNKREGYRSAFAEFDVDAVAALGDDHLADLMENQGIIRNRQKIWSARTNARAFIDIRERVGSFDAYLWNWVDGPIDHRLVSESDVVVSNSLSDALSKDLKKRGFKFVGTTIIYAYLQATGVINDHVVDCSARDAG